MANEFQNYQGMVARVSSGLKEMSELCGELGLAEKEAELNEARGKMEEHTFSVGILGEFKRGKSTVINSLLEKEIVPADIRPTTATVNRITYDLQPHAEIVKKDGNKLEIPVDQLTEYVTKLDESRRANAAQVREAVVYYPCKFCQNGVDIIDTPGLNDETQMDSIVEEIIPKLDAVIMVLIPDSPFSDTEAKFVRNKILASDLGKIIFIVNKIDYIRRPTDREKALKEIQERIRKGVLEKVESTYGKNSEEYQDAAMKMGKLHVYPLSALDALDGKLEGDQELIKKSGTVEFEETLTRMLTEERGALELCKPLNQIRAAMAEILGTIAARKNALSLSQDDFEEKQKETLGKMQKVKEQKNQAIQTMREKSSAVKKNARAMIRKYYEELPEKVNQLIDGADLDNELNNEAKKKTAIEQLSGQALELIQQETDTLTERILAMMRREIEAEIENVNNLFSVAAADLLDALPGVPRTDKPGELVTDIAADVGVFYASALGAGIPLWGVGGILQGFKTAGVKGAVVGGGVAVAVSIAALMVAPTIAVTGLPAMVIASTLGTVSGKEVVKKLFSKDVHEREEKKIKGQVKQNIQDYIRDQIRGGRKLENWVDEQINVQFDELVSAYESDTRRLLSDTQATIDAIRKDLTIYSQDKKQKEERFKDMESTVAKLWKEELAPISQRIAEALQEVPAEAEGV